MFAFTQVRLGVLYAGTSRTSLLVTPLSANTRVNLGTAASHKKYGGYNSGVHRHSAHSFSTIFRTVCFNPGEVVDQEVSSFWSKIKMLKIRQNDRFPKKSSWSLSKFSMVKIGRAPCQC